MKSWWQEINVAVIAFLIWRATLEIIVRNAHWLWSLRPKFLGVTPWANFDGVHYVSIAQNGYRIYQYAFFPFYSIVLRILGQLFPFRWETTAQIISGVSFLVGIVFFLRLLRLLGHPHRIWALVLLLSFPTSFFFSAVYTSAIYFLLTVMTLYFIAAKRWLLAGVFAMLASATQFFGVLLVLIFAMEFFRANRKTQPYILRAMALVPLGLVSYMIYLRGLVGDPLAFVHVQPAFGAGRSGGSIVLLPQVLYRYAKIFVSIPPDSIVYHVAVFELIVFLFGLTVLWLSRSTKLTHLYGLYCLVVLIVPTLSGTLSSMPRYFLSAFPLFFLLTSVHNTRMYVILLFLFSLGFIYFASAFFRGYFVS